MIFKQTFSKATSVSFRKATSANFGKATSVNSRKTTSDNRTTCANNTNAARSLTLLFGLFLSIICINPVHAKFSASTSEALINKYTKQPFDDFNSFVLEVSSKDKDLFTPKDYEAIKAFGLNPRLSEEQSHVIYRLAGVYTQLKYGDEALSSLKTLVAIPSFRAEGIEQHDNENFVRLENEIASMAKDFGLNYRNVDNRVYEVSIDGVNNTVVGFHAHGDVVPVNLDQWVLEDGTKLDPFKVTRIGNRLYGRGTQDDKNGIVVAMYAMRVIKEEKIELFNNIKLLIDTTEETTGTAMPYYLERNSTPGYNLALDGGYPVVIAEKGFGIVKATFPITPVDNSSSYVKNVVGGAAYNQIPAVSTATIVSEQASHLATQLTEAAKGYIASNGGNFSIEAEVVDGGVVLKVKGESAHSSAPGSGVNPVSRMLGFINQLAEPLGLASNHITAAASYAHENWGLDYSGKNLGIDYEHDFMGPLTAAITKLTLTDAGFEVGVNVRAPTGRTATDTKSVVLGKLEQWQKESGSSAVTFEMNLKEPMYRDPKGKWVNALLDIATENLSLPREFGSSSGTTSIHDLPNGVQFGLSVPGEKYTGHNANEFKTIDQFLLDLRIVTETISRLGQMRDLE